MKKIFNIAFALILISGCGKNSIIVPPEITQETEIVYLSNETESVIEFLNPAQTGLMTSEMMDTQGFVMLSYSQFVDETGNYYDTTIAYAVFRDLNSSPINIGHWRERKGLDMGDIYLEDIKLEKSTRRMRMPQHHHQMDTAYGFEYKLKTVNFDFKHSSKHKFKIVDKIGNERIFEIETPSKKELDALPEYDGKNLEIKLKTKSDSVNIIINAPADGETFKPIMMLKIKNLPDSKIKIDSTTINLIPAEYRQNYLVFSIVEKRRKKIVDIPEYPGNVLGFASSTLYFKVKLR